MNKRTFWIALIIFLAISGCAKKGDLVKPAIKINNFKMTAGEFEELFKEAPASIVGSDNNPKARLLEDLINRKLILQEAERLGLNSDKEFLRSIERFYEQSLLKIVIDKKSNEFSSNVTVPDSEIETYYNDLKQKGIIQKPLVEAYKEVKWQLMRRKQVAAFEKWGEELHKKAKIEIDKKALGIENAN